MQSSRKTAEFFEENIGQQTLAAVRGFESD